MGPSELLVIVVSIILLFNPIARDGFITGFKEGLKEKFKK